MPSKKHPRKPPLKTHFSPRVFGGIFTTIAMAAKSFSLRPTWILLTFILVTTFYIYVSTSSSPSPASFRRPILPKPEEENTTTTTTNPTFNWNARIDLHPITKPIQIPTSTRKSKKIPKIQFKFPAINPKKLDKFEIVTYDHNLEHLETVKITFLRGWHGYRNRAWGSDFLLPVSGKRGVSSNVTKDYGFAITLVEALDMLMILGLEKEVEEAIEVVGRLDFSKSDERIVEVFEIAKSVLGGLISAHDLSGGKYPILLVKAVELGDFLLGAFDTVNRMPVTRWEWKRTQVGKEQEAFDDMILSELGGMTLEFTRLTQLSGDPKFFDAVQRIQDMLEKHQDVTQLPGMWPIVIDATEEGKFDAHNSFTLGLMADSVYACLPKHFLQLGGHSDQSQNMYTKAITTAQARTFFKPMTVDSRDILFSSLTRVSAPDTTILEPQIHQQDCSIGGMIALASKIFSRPDDLEVAKKLVDGCIWASEIFPSGLMPETFYVVPCENGRDCFWDENAYLDAVVSRDENITLETVHSAIEDLRLEPGIVDLLDVRSLLRHDVIESIFILYRITGDQKLRDAAWKIFEALDYNTRTEHGNSVLEDMTLPDEKVDLMGSHWMGATLKYFYLIFSEADVLSLDEFVFSTAGHPFKKPR